MLYRFCRFTQDKLSKETDKYCQSMHLFSYFSTISTSLNTYDIDSKVYRTTFTHDHSKMDRRKIKTVYQIYCDDKLIEDKYIKYDTSCPFKSMTVVTKPHSSLQYRVHYLTQLNT